MLVLNVQKLFPSWWWCFINYFQDVQKAREELDKKKKKVNNVAEKTLKQEPCDQNAPVIKCQVVIILWVIIYPVNY